MGNKKAVTPQVLLKDGKGSKSTTKVFWTQSERSRFARAYIQLENSHEFTSWPDVVERTCDRLVTEGLMAESRRRHWTPGFFTAPKIKAAIERERELAKQLVISATAEPPKSPPPTTYELLVMAGRQLLKDILQPTASSAGDSTPLLPLVSESLKPLVDALLPEVRRAVREEIESALGGGPEGKGGESQILPTLPQLPTIPPAAKRKVLVVGLLGKQAEEVARSFSSMLELRFLTQEDSITRIVQHAKNCDVSLGLVGYMGHHVDNALNKHAMDYHRCNGTVSDVKRVLSTLVSH